MLPSNPTPYTLLLHEPQPSSYDCLLQMHPCSDTEFQHSRGALPRNSIPQSLQIDPACQNPSLSLPVAQTLAMNIASQSTQDWGKQNPAGGRKKNPPAGVFLFYYGLGFFWLLLHLWKRIHLKPTYNPATETQSSTTHRQTQFAVTYHTKSLHMLTSSIRPPACHHPVAVVLIGNTIPGSLKIHPVCKSPGLSLPGARTLAINVTSTSGQDQGNETQLGEGKIKIPQLSWFGEVLFCFVLKTMFLIPTYLNTNRLSHPYSPKEKTNLTLTASYSVRHIQNLPLIPQPLIPLLTQNRAPWPHACHKSRSRHIESHPWKCLTRYLKTTSPLHMIPNV